MIFFLVGVTMLLPGSAHAEQVTCGETITADTKLADDLIGCTGDGIVIGANGIILDLNGHTIEGTFNPRQTGINNSYDEVTIEGGTIRGFGTGVDMVGDRNVLRDLILPLGLETGILSVGDGNRVVRSSVLAGFGGISITGDRNRIKDSDVNGSDGIDIRGTDNYVKRSHVAGRSVGGINVFSGANVIKGNFATGGFFPSIYAVDAAGTRVESNVATGSQSSGIRVGASVIVAKNTAYDNGNFGIEADSGVIDGGGNRAFGNDNPLQCLNVVCKVK